MSDVLIATATSASVLRKSLIALRSAVVIKLMETNIPSQLKACLNSLRTKITTILNTNRENRIAANKLVIFNTTTKNLTLINVDKCLAIINPALPKATKLNAVFSDVKPVHYNKLDKLFK